MWECISMKIGLGLGLRLGLGFLGLGLGLGLGLLRVIFSSSGAQMSDIAAAYTGNQCREVSYKTCTCYICQNVLFSSLTDMGQGVGDKGSRWLALPRLLPFSVSRTCQLNCAEWTVLILVTGYI